MMALENTGLEQPSNRKIVEVKKCKPQVLIAFPMPVLGQRVAQAGGDPWAHPAQPSKGPRLCLRALSASGRDPAGSAAAPTVWHCPWERELHPVSQPLTCTPSACSEQGAPKQARQMQSSKQWVLPGPGNRFLHLQWKLILQCQTLRTGWWSQCSEKNYPGTQK